MLFGLGRSRRLVGVGLDGLPYSLAERMMRDGLMPNLRAIADEGTIKRIKSVYPTVSNVAWSAFQTGENPGRFGVFGFVDLRPDLEMFIPNREDLKCSTIWDRLEKAGKKYASLSVPLTYPAPKGDGFVVSGFLAPRLDESAVSNPAVLPKLESMGYEIDIDPAAAIESIDRFKEDLTRVSQARQRTALALLEEDGWDFLFVHVMDTDRINHFMWKHRDEPETENGRFFRDFYGGIDAFLGRLREAAGDDYEMMVCSDHGFCELRWEVQLNRWLKNGGYLDYENAPDKGYKAVKRGSRAVALVPGRVHILRESAWQSGVVTEKEYEPLRRELMDKLRAIRHPETGEVVCRQVMRREEVFDGPHAEAAPDIVIDPCDGFDLKARLGAGHLFDKGPRSGMHTYGDAMLAVSEGLESLTRAGDIIELGRRVRKYLL